MGEDEGSDEDEGIDEGDAIFEGDATFEEDGNILATVEGSALATGGGPSPLLFEQLHEQVVPIVEEVPNPKV